MMINGGWHKMGPDNRPLCSLKITIFELDEKQDVSKFNTVYLDVLVRYKRTDFAKEPTEKGDIDGIEFTRYHWSAKKDGQKIRGAVYVGKEGRHVIAFEISAPAEGHDSDLKLMENAVLTVRKP